MTSRNTLWQYRVPGHFVTVMGIAMMLACWSAHGQPLAPGGKNHVIQLEAVSLADELYGYRMERHTIDGEDVTTSRYGADRKASLPGPTLVFTEGDHVNVTLTNKVPCEMFPDRLNGARASVGRARIGIHVHGVHYEIGSDGTPKMINKQAHQGATCGGGTYDYEWDVAPGTAGTWPYHDHTFTEETGAEQMGLFGTVIVNPSDGNVTALIDGAIKPVNLTDITKEYVLWMVSANGIGRSLFYGMEIDHQRGGRQTYLWINPMLLAAKGKLVRFHVLGLGDEFHAFHLHGHRWIEPEKTENVIDVREIAPVERHAFVLRAGEGVGPGDWMYHCHVFRHMEEGMSGLFRVLPEGADDALPEVGAAFTLSDEPGPFMKAIDRGLLEALDPREGIGFPLDFVGSGSRSVAVIRPGQTVLWSMRDSVTVHTITSLIWPKAAMLGDKPFPFDMDLMIRGSTLFTDAAGRAAALTEPGLYVFVCKVHPYMFAAVIVDEDGALPLDFGKEVSVLTRTGGLPGTLPTTVPSLHALPRLLLTTFFAITDTGNWKDYRQDNWSLRLPDVEVTGSIDGQAATTVSLNDLESSMRGLQRELKNPARPGVGEIWVNTQFELTRNKQGPKPGFRFDDVVDASPAEKPGTITVVDAANWAIKRKIALPEESMVHPHNMWADKTLGTVYQTQWFERRLTTLDRASGRALTDSVVGQSPSHVITAPGSDRIYVALNGEEQVAELDPTTLKMTRELSMGLDSHPHGHWIGLYGGDSRKPFLITPNFFSNNSTIFDLVDNEGCTVDAGAGPIAIGVAPDGSKYYVADFLGNSLTVVETMDDDDDGDVDCGRVSTTIDLLQDTNGDGEFDGGLPIQTPVSPDGRWMVTAQTLTKTLTVVDTGTDSIVAVLPCGPGCHGVNWGAKRGGGYYAYATTKFANILIVLDPRNGPNAEVVGRVPLYDRTLSQRDDDVIGLDGMGGQGVLPIPIVYKGYIQETVAACETAGNCRADTRRWLSNLHPRQRDP